MNDISNLQDTLTAASQILDRAIMIVKGAPFFTEVYEEEYARVVIEGDTANVYWPEVQSGYYDSTSIEKQSKSFPAELLLMTVPEIEIWKAAEKKKYNDEQKLKTELAVKERARQQTAAELATLAALQKKYAPQPYRIVVA